MVRAPTLHEPARQSGGLAAEQQHVFVPELHAGEGRRTSGREEVHTTPGGPVPEGLFGVVFLEIDLPPVVDPAAPNLLLVGGEAQRVDQVELRSKSDAQATDVARVARDLGRQERDVEAQASAVSEGWTKDPMITRAGRMTRVPTR
ncbi:MAG TPA: hypothetical protein QGF58_05675 [Myxococcota bacterium]|nr:hypothetical protein [Myxococcota bacterium]